MKIKKWGWLFVTVIWVGLLLMTGTFNNASSAEQLILQPLPVDSSGNAEGGEVIDEWGGVFQLKLATLAAEEDSCWMTFRLGPIITEGVTAILGWLRLAEYSDTGSIATDTLTCRLFTSYAPDYSTLTLSAIDSNKFTDTGTWFINIDNDTLLKPYLYIDMEAITPDNCDNDSADYGATIEYRVHGEIIKQKYE